MEEIKGNIWDYHNQGYFITITTNGEVDRNNHAIMGAGIAKQAKEKFPSLPNTLGTSLMTKGNIPFLFPEFRIITLPTKEEWRKPSDLTLIVDSCKTLVDIVNNFSSIPIPIYLPKPGCHNGSQLWKVVKEVINPILDDRFIICDLRG